MIRQPKAPHAGYLTVPVLLALGLTLAGCSFQTQKSGLGWECWTENAGKHNEIELCERRYCRDKFGRFEACK